MDTVHSAYGHLFLIYKGKLWRMEALFLTALQRTMHEA